MEHKVKILHDGKPYIMRAMYDNDLMFKNWSSTKRFYEIRLLNKLQEMGRKGVYVDVGANMGNHSIFFLNHCPSTEVISIEASPEIAKLLKINVMNNNNVNKPWGMIERAITAKKQMVTLKDIMSRNVGATSILKTGTGDVPSDTLDALVGDIKNIAVLKLDIEGFEVPAIKGASKILKTQSPIVTAELAKEKQFQNFKAEISKYGYVTDGLNWAGTPTYIWTKG